MNPIAIAHAAGRFAQSAEKVAAMNVGGMDIDLVREVVDMKLAEAGVSANAAVLRTADQMTGVVLDILA